jgi:hypothetical protein
MENFASQLFASLNEGGVWLLPRTALVFRKEGRTMVLQDAMPWQDGMPWSEEEWLSMQSHDLMGVTHMFAAIGVTVQEYEL